MEAEQHAAEQPTNHRRNKELNRQSMSDAGYSMLGAGAWG